MNKMKNGGTQLRDNSCNEGEITMFIKLNINQTSNEEKRKTYIIHKNKNEELFNKHHSQFTIRNYFNCVFKQKLFYSLFHNILYLNIQNNGIYLDKKINRVRFSNYRPCSNRKRSSRGRFVIRHNFDCSICDFLSNQIILTQTEVRA